MKKSISFAIVLGVYLLSCAPSFALKFDNNITIFDNYSSSATGWHGAQEDNEVEPGMVANQGWDLEGFFQDGNILSLVGGFNFMLGNGGVMSGDVFIDVDGPPVYGKDSRAGSNGNYSVSNTYGYDFVFDLDLGNMSYRVFNIDATTELQTAYYVQNEGSSPWQYDAGDKVAIADGSLEFIESLTDSVTGFSGLSHYALTGLDLSFLGHGNNFYSHFTMGCGNDNLMGQGTTVPEPSTVLLLGSGLLGIVWLVRKRKKA